MHVGALLLALPLAAAALSAQTTAAAADAPHIVIDGVGPDGWRMRFGPTNLGSLLESEKGRALWQPHVLPVLDQWRKMLGDDATYDAMRARLVGYGGRVRVGVWFDQNDVRGGRRWNHAVVLIDGDGRTDLAALGKDLRDLQYRTFPGEWVEVDVSGAKVTARKQADETMTAPLLEGTHLRIVWARDDDLAAAFARATPLTADLTGKPPAPNTPALRMQFDVAAMLKAELDDDRNGDFMKALGFGSLGTANVTVGTAGPQVLVEMAQQFTNEQRGLFGIFFPASTGVSPLVQVAGASPGSWKVGRLDFRPLYSLIEAVATSRSWGAEDNTPEKVREQMKESLGIDLEKDLLAHLTDEAVLLGSPMKGLDSARETTWSLTIRLRDEAAFTKGLMAMLPKARPMLSREAEDKHGDIPVYRYGGMFGYDLWLAVGNGVFVVAGGRDAEEALGLVLDRCKELPKEAPPAPGFEGLQKYLPPGTNGLATGEVGSVLMLPSELWFGLLGDIPPLFGGDAAQPPDADQREAILALLREHKLDVLRTATGFHERQWRWRMFW